MSLINDALKKAQTERPGHADTTRDQPVAGGLARNNPEPARKRNYIWGFLMSVLIVGLFTTSLTTYLVFKILGKEEPVAERNAPVRMVQDQPPQPETPMETAGTSAGNSLLPGPGPADQESAAGTIQANPGLPGSESEAAPVEETGTSTLADVTPPVLPPQSQVPNAAAWARLDQLEIRGMLSGGTKVLIYDSGTGKTRSFVEGDLVDGALGLKIASIQSNTIIFKDYGGYELTKSF